MLFLQFELNIFTLLLDLVSAVNQYKYMIDICVHEQMQWP